MKSLLTAIALLTRVPVPASAETKVAGEAMRWFPLIGALIAAVYLAIAALSRPALPASVAAVLILVAEALLTGALHMDGLADTADGFGAGKNPGDCLRIMRDHSIGTYGAVAIALLVALKVTTLTALLERHHAWPYLWWAPVLSRWSVVPLSRFLPYARPAESVFSFVTGLELLWATVLAALLVIPAGPWTALLCWLVVAAASAWFGLWSRRKIGGITGDTLGATVEICECLVLLTGLLL
ncbi:MAG: adenosylcobinamide-GDP ribazoletransferase [Acidobacteriia bacterium]|nr:adenosylcobinamide-GDP ribazoletransferase [Terriglobia bacterium]